jgi:hypothetical protein
MSTETTPDESRRGFLKLAATAPVAAGAVAVTGTEAAAETTDAHKGLADTAETRAYYSSARF